MRLWSVALLGLVFASFCCSSTGCFDFAALKDGLISVLGELGPKALWEARRLSQDFYKLAVPVFHHRYSIRINGRAHPHYPKLAWELDRLVRAEKHDGRSISEALEALGKSLDFLWISSTLNDAFGYCIRYTKEELPEFRIRGFLVDQLNDLSRISVLPFLLDVQVYGTEWVQCICGLADRNRLDLLNELTFPYMDSDECYCLMGTEAHASVILAGAKSLAQNEPDSKLLDELALIQFVDRRVDLGRAWRVSLVVFYHLLVKDLAYPKNMHLFNGLHESSIPFWKYLSRQNNAALLDFVVKHGDAECIFVASAFQRLVDPEKLPKAKHSVYRAAVVHFHFGPMCNPCVAQNYQSLLGNPNLDYRGISALLEYRQYVPIRRAPSYRLDGWEMLELCRRAYGAKRVDLIQRFARSLPRVLNLSSGMKNLVRRRAEDAYIKVFWDILQKMARKSCHADYYCGAPLDALKSIMFGLDYSLTSVLAMLSTVKGYRLNGKKVSAHSHILHTLIFWEAREVILAEYLERIPSEVLIDFGAFHELMCSTEYSTGFILKNIRRCGALNSKYDDVIKEFRPDIVLPEGLTFD